MGTSRFCHSREVGRHLRAAQALRYPAGIANAFLFDLDGTLIDSEHAHKTAEVVTLKTFGLDVDLADLFQFTGVPYKTMLATLEQRFGVGLPLDAFFERHKPTLLAKIGSDIKLFDDVEGCLDRLAERPLALATSSPVWYVEAVLRTYPALGVFKHVICADDVKHGKPHPEAFLSAAATIGIDPKGCAAIEDSTNGVASAKAAGCYTIGVRRDDRIDLSHADELVHSLAEIERLPSSASG